jgi:hypothetical protein
MKAELSLCKGDFAPGERRTFHRMPILLFKSERLLFHGKVRSFIVREMLIDKEDQFSGQVPAAMFANAPVVAFRKCPPNALIVTTIECTEKKPRWWEFWKAKDETYHLHGRILGTVAVDRPQDLDLWKQADVEYLLGSTLDKLDKLGKPGSRRTS